MTSPKDRTVEALREVWASLSDLLGTLPDDSWSTPTALPGWDVKDNVAHVIGTEAMLAGRPIPELTVDRAELPHVHNDAGAFNEAWVQSMRAVAPADVRSSFAEITTERLAALDAMSQEEWDAESFTPAGRSTYGRFMQIRVFDCWLHEQDIRDAVGVPGDETGLPVEVTLDELETALGFVVGKRAGVETGKSVRFELTDSTAVVRVVDVEVAERAGVVDELVDPTVTIRLPVGSMMRLSAGRAALDAHRDRIRLDGDVELGERVLGNLNYTI